MYTPITREYVKNSHQLIVPLRRRVCYCERARRIMKKFPYFTLAGISLFIAAAPFLIRLGNLEPYLSGRTTLPERQPQVGQIRGKDFELFADPNVWQAASSPDQAVILSLQPALGHASFVLTVHPEPASFDQLTALYQTNHPSATTSPTTVNDQPALEVTLTESHFDETASYKEYAIPLTRGYLQLTVKTDGLPTTALYVHELVSGLHVLDRNVRGTRTNDQSIVSQIAQLASPSVVGLLSVHCFEATSSDPQLLDAPYHFCFSQKGSGFIITPEGHVATNGHSVVEYPEQALTKNLLAQSVQPLTRQFISFLSPNASALERLRTLESNPTALNALITAVYELFDRHVIRVAPTKSRFFVRLGREPFSVNSELLARGEVDQALGASEVISPARLIAAAVPNYYSTDSRLRGTSVFGPDVGLLKLEYPHLNLFPALPLATTQNLLPGAPVVLIGFPELVAGDPGTNSLLNYDVASVTPTVSAGIVSAIKEDQAGNTLIQTDAGLGSGNSGGPALDENGRVVGIATYAFDAESANFNFARDISELHAVLEKQQVARATPNRIFETWDQALQQFSQRRYRQALQNFRLVKQLYPIHPTVDSLVAQTEEKIPGFTRAYVKTVARIAWFAAFVSAAAILLFLGVRHRRSAASPPQAA